MHIFISYSKLDIDFARYLRALLEAEGFRVWMDEARLHPGEDWWESIMQNIDTCAALLVVMTPEAQTSKWVQREILYAEKLNRPIFPVLLIGEIWPRLADIQYEDMRTGLHAKLSRAFVATLREVIPQEKQPQREILFSIQSGDILAYEADVVAFKYARFFQGADRHASDALIAAGIDEMAISPDVGDFTYGPTEGGLAAPNVLFVGTPHVRTLDYHDLRALASRILTILAREAPETRHLALTLHGPGFGLDEQESMLSQFAGIKDVMDANALPPSLERITIVEFNEERTERLRGTLTPVLQGLSSARKAAEDWGYALTVGADNGQNSAAVITESRPKTHAAVVMPQQGDYEDFFYYGVQSPVHALGLLCERVETNEQGENLLVHVRARIDNAAVVIAEVSQPDPAVYLQIGYALGRGCPVVYIARKGTASMFTPDIQYDKLRTVEAALSKHLDKLKAEGQL